FISFVSILAHYLIIFLRLKYLNLLLFFYSTLAKSFLSGLKEKSKISCVILLPFFRDSASHVNRILVCFLRSFWAFSKINLLKSEKLEYLSSTPSENRKSFTVVSHRPVRRQE